jgi:Ca2+-binding RTX toxin-like protein
VGKPITRFGFVTIITVATSLPLVPARAAVTSGVEDQVLQVMGDGADDAIDITCVGGNAKVNGNDPDTGMVSCASLHAIGVRGRGGTDHVTLEHVTVADFPSVSETYAIGGSGDDTLIGSPEADYLDGGAGYDTVSGAGSSDEILPGPDGGSVDGGGAFDLVSVDGGGRWLLSDSLLVHQSPPAFAMPLTSVEGVEIVGGDGNDRVGAGAFTGDVFLVGGGGDDRFIGGTGNDRMSGLGGDDRLFGSAGKDRLRGGGGNDLLEGERDDDELFGGPGADHCRGGSGRDRILGC